jgi:pilus assembly protein Flp/PilA
MMANRFYPRHVVLMKGNITMFAYSCALAERMKAELTLLRGDRKGVTALEYGLLAGLIAVVIIGGATTLGTAVSTMFTNIAGYMKVTAS